MVHFGDTVAIPDGDLSTYYLASQTSSLVRLLLPSLGLSLGSNPDEDGAAI